MRRKISTAVDVGRVKGLACADPERGPPSAPTNAAQEVGLLLCSHLHLFVCEGLGIGLVGSWIKG